MANVIYNTFFDELMKNLVDLDDHTIKCALFTSSYTPAATDSSYSALTGEVASGGGYTTGGATLAGKTVSGAGGVRKFDANDVTWAASTITARYAIIYDDTHATKQVIALFDFGGNKSSSSGDFVVEWNSNGILTFQQA